MRTFWATVALGLGAAAALNFWVDVPRRFWRRPPPPPATWDAGRVLVLPDYFDERRARRAMLAGRPAPEVLILGSSRAMLARPSMAGAGGAAYNAALSGAALEDYAGVWELLRRKGALPARVLWLVDDWAANANDSEADWQGNADLAAAFLRRRRLWPLWLETLPARARQAFRMSDLLELLNWNMVKLSARRVWDGTVAVPPTEGALLPEARRPAASDAWREDGSRIDPSDVASKSPEAVRQTALAYGRLESVYPYGRYRPDPRREAFLRALIDDMAASGTKVLLVVPPMHPAARATLDARPDQRELTPHLLSVLRSAQRPGVSLCDATRAGDSGCSDAEFMDGIHPRSSCMAKVLARCVAQAPEWRSGEQAVSRK